MLKLSQGVQRIAESATMAIDSRAKAMKQAGENVIALAAGEPDFDTPAHIVRAANEALAAGFTRYTPASGIAELRAAWADKVGRERGISFKPNQLMITAGGKQALFNVVYALVDAGDEVIIPAPYWVSYTEQVKAVGATPVIVSTSAQENFKMSAAALRQAITPRTRLLILNSPSNPTGSVYSRAELTALAEVLVEKQVPVLSDEVYDCLIYGTEVEQRPPFDSIASLGDEILKLTVVVGAASKAYAMTGWRIGFAAGPADLIAACGRLQSQTTSGPNSIAQKAALAAITGDQGTVEVMRQEFDRRRRYMVERLNAMPHITCPVPTGAFYAFPKISAYYGQRYDQEPVNGSMDFCRLLLEHEKLALVPGVEFGHDEHVRLSYAASMAQIQEALNRLERFLARLD